MRLVDKKLIERLGFTEDMVQMVAESDVPGLIDQAVERIRNAPFPHASMYMGHSGGKDSALTLYLVDKALGDNVTIVHSPKPTGVENAVHPMTQEYLYRLDRPIHYCPLKDHSRFYYKTQIDGTRRDEYRRTDGRSVDVVMNGVPTSRQHMTLYLEDGLFGINFVYPIFDWSDIQVWSALYALQIPITEEYWVV